MKMSSRRLPGMNRDLRSLNPAAVSLGLLCCLLANYAAATVTTWDPQASNAQNPYLGSLSQTWENAKWSTSQTGQGTPQAWVENTAALFAVHTGTGTPAFSVTMNGNHTVAGIFDGPLTPNPCPVTITGTGTMTIPAGWQGFQVTSDTSNPGSVTVNNIITGSGGIEWEGATGSLLLYGVNTYSGGFYIAAGGGVTFGNNAAFGSGTIYWGAGGFIQPAGATAYNIGNAMAHTNLVETFANNSGGVTFSGGWTLPASGNTTTIANFGTSANAITVSGAIGGAGALTINTGTANYQNPWTFTGVNTFSGALTITAGTLSIGGSGSLGSGTYAGAIANSGTFTWNSSASQTLSGAFSSSSGTFNVNGSGTLTLSGTTDNNALGATVNSGGKLVLAKTSSGTVHALGSATTVNSGGTLQLGGSGGDQIYSGVAVTVNSGGVFDANGKSESMTSLTLSGTGISSAGALINSASATTATITGTAATGFPLGADTSMGGVGNLTLAGVIGGAHALTKVGTGTFTLNSANSYSGNTTVSAGTLALGANNVLPSTTTLNLAGGTLNMGTFNDTVHALQFSGAGKAQGTWGSSSSTANHKDAQFAGTGILTVSTGGRPPPRSAQARTPRPWATW